MKCEVIRDLLPLYLDEACTPDTREEVENHLRECADCRSFLEQMGEYPSEKEIEENLIEKQTMEKKKTDIKYSVRIEIMKKTVLIDMVVNTLLLAVSLALLLRGMIPEGMGLSIALVFVVLLVIWEICECIFQFRLIKHKLPGVTEHISEMSIYIKIALVIIGLIVSILHMI